MKSNFKLAYKKLIVFEGGYVFDKDDPGGETYKGISRRSNSGWRGWQIIDSAKAGGSFPDNLEIDEELQNLTAALYETLYWNKLFAPMIDHIIAEELFEQAVNFGVEAASERLQKSLNILNRNQRDYEDIKVDGSIGRSTIDAYKRHVLIHGTKLLYNVLNGFQIKRYIELMESNPVREKYIGWFNRVEIIK